MFRTWRKVEIPCRTPPLPEQFLYAIANYAISRADVIFAGLLVLGFEGLLRTGELLSLTPQDILLRNGETLIHLKHTKTSRRKAATEVVHFEHSWAYVVLESAKELAIHFQGLHTPMWGASHQLFRKRFRQYLKVFQLHRMGFRPYSLRRGGATALFLRTKSYDAALQTGRWESVKAAKVYIQLYHVFHSSPSQQISKLWSPIGTLYDQLYKSSLGVRGSTIWEVQFTKWILLWDHRRSWMKGSCFGIKCVAVLKRAIAKMRLPGRWCSWWTYDSESFVNFFCRGDWTNSLWNPWLTAKGCAELSPM